MALGVAAIMLVLGLPSFATFLRNNEIRSTTESVANGLRAARAEAVRRGTSVSFTINAGAGRPDWNVNQLSDASLIQSYSRQEGGANVSVGALPAGANSVAFNRLGRIVPVAAGGSTIQQLDFVSRVDSDARALRIYVDGVRGIRMCDPSPLLANLNPPDPRAC